MFILNWANRTTSTIIPTNFSGWLETLSGCTFSKASHCLGWDIVIIIGLWHVIEMGRMAGHLELMLSSGLICLTWALSAAEGFFIKPSPEVPSPSSSISDAARASAVVKLSMAAVTPVLLELLSVSIAAPLGSNLLRSAVYKQKGDQLGSI